MLEILGTGLQLGRMRGEDRYYIPVKARKNQSQPQRYASDRSRNDGFESPNPSTKKKISALGKEKPKEPMVSTERPSQDLSVASHSNLERFLESTTPSVPAQYLSKVSNSFNGWYWIQPAKFVREIYWESQNDHPYLAFRLRTVFSCLQLFGQMEFTIIVAFLLSFLLLYSVSRRTYHIDSFGADDNEGVEDLWCGVPALLLTGRFVGVI